ncbi:hypothetical protein IC620_12990 [Hazenella sp. IB182357]|uniref:Endospore appendages core domain-containing protein n=1 Tax=Polycladospora coralii TaxID=2771432 RepID=A0A926ND96_9BACL|nr:S-Ena type endospore appendage [Polycladospora coralii]MBD1373265.1 hypothetical protein [Polycladospora coralii]MBS7528878.1 hypothetical protein [Polycladospora coralii]
MCNSSVCSPSSQVVKEVVSGNFSIGDTTGPVVWIDSNGSYIQGTFQVFNSSTSTSGVVGTVDNATMETANAGNTISQVFKCPTEFQIVPVSQGSISGSYCITLWKFVLA